MREGESDVLGAGFYRFRTDFGSLRDVWSVQMSGVPGGKSCDIVYIGG